MRFFSKQAGEIDQSNQLDLPQTPRASMRTGARASAHVSAMLTPRTLTEGGERGQVKRTLLLERQLVQMSKTASEAYDEIEELNTRNAMLMEQVDQQKELIKTLTAQLDEARQTQQPAFVSASIQASPVSVRSAQSNSSDQSHSHSAKSSETSATSINSALSTENALQKHQIVQLNGRISELEQIARRESTSHRDAINQLSSSVLAISANREFLSQEMPAFEMPRRLATFGKPERPDGETFVVPVASGPFSRSN